jgi:hypothetical protein|tara:strand:+ start:1099 stop:1926 length:828 start_codon:yes stop_codon:yes gene_type:complete
MGNFSRSLSVTPNDTINTLPAWEFMNQTGSLGNNLRGSLIYVGGTAAASNVSVITAGTVGIQNRVVSLTLTNGGSGYAVPPANPQGTTYTSVVPTSIGPKVASGLTVNITVPVPTTNTLVPGTGYSVAPFTVLQGGGLSGNILSVNGTGGILTFEITDGGVGYAVGDVLTIVDGAGINGSITLVTAPNGAVTLAPIAVGGEGYAVGDIITIVQAGSGGDATCTVDAVRSFSPVAGDAVVFNNVPVGTVLPVYVDYVTATGTTATLLVAGRESILD